MEKESSIFLEHRWDAETERLHQYATAATLLYGVLSLGELAEIVNQYEQTDYKAIKVAKLLKPTLDIWETWFTIDAGLLIGPALGAQTGDWVVAQLEQIRDDQASKTRYLPASKDEFLAFRNEDTLISAPPYLELQKYFEHKPHSKYEHPLKFPEDAIDWVSFEIRDGIPMREILNQMTEAGLEFDDEVDLENLLSILSDVWNNTRMFENNGFTPNELHGSAIFARK